MAEADDALLAALTAIAERGAIGERSLPVAVAHAEQFVAVIPKTARRAADLGSGGGLPGLVIATRCPWLEVTLVERRAQRADLLRRAVSSLALGERVVVIDTDVSVVARHSPGGFQVVTARSFAAPAITARWASELLEPAGLLVVSEPPEDDPERWPVALLARTGLIDVGRYQGVRCFQRR